MNPIQQQKFNTFVGGLFIGTGALAWLMAVAFAVLPNDEAPAPVTMAPYVDMNTCAQGLQRLGYQVETAGVQVVAHEALDPSGNVEPQLVRASVAWNLCRVPVTDFCVGGGCEKPGITLTVRGQVGKARPAVPVVAVPKK